jgi:hypothetical protein
MLKDVGGQWYQVPAPVNRKDTAVIIHNNDIKKLAAEIPEGHKHIRITILLQDGTELVFHEASIANLVRAYITVKTHPTIRKIELKGKHLSERKDGFAEWQLLQE